ncbi:acyl-CoA dehydrogenase family protein [Nocardia stercoris]|uniref:Acyl-CoA dehydrogenase n=1 Tax=Nocardia stercoris TaxID=2483361 RepID=A0A3M2L403_9NOCA|nr:acyl-CoA dehydrogenase family protein [Nocardia stercoris]RMI29238.1 acyl-CoA dehydrogenase [Nocardia stercoris]
MDFSPDEGRQAVAAVVADVLDRHEERDERLWPTLLAAGLPGLAVPEEFGGDGMGIGEVATLLSELAAGGARTQLLATLGFGVLPLLAGPALPAKLAEQIFPAVLEGAVLTAAWHEPGHPLTLEPTTRAEVTGDQVRVTGRKVAVPYADTAAWLLVPTGAGLAVIPAGAPGLELRPSPSSTGAPEFSLHLDGVSIPAENLLDGDLAARQRYATAALGATAEGLLRGALTITAEHVATRRQFGRPLAEFQAVAQQIADVDIAARTVSVTATSAAWALAQDDPSPELLARIDDDLAVLAYWVAAELSPALQTCHHLHGGIGVDVTHALTRYTTQAKDLTRWLGGAALCLDRLGAACTSI